MDNDYAKLVNFWNNNFILNDELKDKLKNETNIDSYKSLSPSPKHIKVLELFKDKNILDYGCGNGWASIISSKLGTNHIDSVDVSKNAINILNFNKELYKVNNIDSFKIDSKWIEKVESNKYDGFFSSNVIDVIPLEMSKRIIKESSRIVKDGSYVIFSLNYYMDLKNNNKYVIKNKQVYIDDILRLTSLTDKEWINIFKKFFNEVKLEYFSWPGEKEEKRRLFILKK